MPAISEEQVRAFVLLQSKSNDLLRAWTDRAYATDTQLPRIVGMAATTSSDAALQFLKDAAGITDL